MYNDRKMANRLSRKEKIQQRLRQLGQNPNWLARQIDKPKQSVYQWIEGANPRDPETVWPAIAKALGLRDHRVLLDDTLELDATQPDEVRVAINEELTDRIRG